MKTDSPVSFYLRIVIICLLVAFIGLGPAPHAVIKLSEDAYQSITHGDQLEAASSLAGIARYYPWRYNLNISAAKYAFQAGEPEAAIQYLERPGTVSHLSAEEMVLLGDAYKETGNETMAEAIWKRAAELGNIVAPYERLAEQSLQQKEYTTAAGYLHQQLILDPSRVGLYLQIGELYAVTDPIKALPFLAQAAEINPSDAPEAKSLYDRIRTANLFDEPAYTALIVGRQLGELGKWELAMAAFQQAITLRPGYADAWAFLGEAKQQVALHEADTVSDIGLAELEQAVVLDSSSTLVNTLMALYCERQGDYPQAEQYINYAMDSSPQDPYLYLELGNILSKAGDLPAAQSAYENAISLSPQDPLFYRQLAQYAMDNNIQIRELALPAARQAVLLDPQDAVSLDLLGQVMLILVDYNSAERFLMDAVKFDPGYAPAYLHLGTAYLYQGKSDLARLWLSRAEGIDADSWVVAQATRLIEYYFP